MSVPSGRLYLVATPLGNPEDLSARAARTLREVDILYAEDTRTARALLSGLGITRAVISCHDHNEGDRATEAAQHLAEGRSVALISEAGTPAISDPGHRLVRAAIDINARVIPVPGPAALITALVASGLPPEHFFFGGFLPRKTAARRTQLQALATLDATLIFYESPMRTAATLQDCLAVLGDRPACVARELTKTHEELVRESLQNLVARYAEARPLGEITLVIAGAAAAPRGDAADAERAGARATRLLKDGLSVRDVTRVLTEETGLSRKAIYALVLAASQALSDTD